MDFILNGFVRLKYWVLSFFYTNEEILDDWIARQVLNLSPRKVCTRPRILGTPKPRKTSFEMPPLVPKCLSPSESSKSHVDSSSRVSPSGNGRYLYSLSRRSCEGPCTFRRSTLGKNPSPLRPSASCDPRVGLERYHPLGVALGSEES